MEASLAYKSALERQTTVEVVAYAHEVDVGCSGQRHSLLYTETKASLDSLRARTTKTKQNKIKQTNRRCFNLNMARQDGAHL